MGEIFHILDISAQRLDAARQTTLESLSRVVPTEFIHEVGSTAVPGVIGKQDLDFLVRAPQSQFVQIRGQLDKVFSRNTNQLSNNQYQGYLVESELDVAIQLTIQGCEFDTFLDFNQRLLNDPSLVSGYNALKRRFDGRDMDSYRQAKRQFIEQALSTPGPSS